MRKKTGNSVVNRAITVAMSSMMIVSTPAMQVYAAESNSETENTLENVSENSTDSSSESNTENQTSEISTTEISQGTDSKYDVSSVELEADSDMVESNIKDETKKYVSKEFFEKVNDAFDDIDITQDYQDVLDESKSIAEGIATEITGSFVENVGESRDNIISAASDANSSNTLLEETKKNLENGTNELLNDDKEIVADVEENTVVDTITPDGNIQINVSSEDGNNFTQGLGSYVTEQNEIVANASDEAKNIVNSISDTSTADEINNAKAEISSLIDEAQEAYDGAQEAVNSAEAVLNKEISDYNSYAQMCGLPQLDDSPNDESQNILQQQIDSLTSQIEESDAKVIEALTKIQTAKELLDNSKKVTNQAQFIIDCLQKTEAALEDTADKWLEDTKDTLGEKSDTFDYCNAAEIVLTNSKKALEENIEIIEKKEYNSGLSEYEEKLKESLVSAAEQCQECIDNLSKDNEDDYFKGFNAYYSAINTIYTEYNKDLEDGQSLPSYHLRFLATIKSGKELTEYINKDIEAKQKEVEVAQEAYDTALEEYKQIRLEYANTANALQYFKPLKKKLDNAAKNLANAKADLTTAELTLKDIKDITVDSVEPVNPENPTVDPVEPVNPENPTVDPVEPVNPENPTVDPVEPVNPENPTVDPIEPIDSGNSVSNSTDSSTKSANVALPIEESNYIVENTATLAPSVETETPVSTLVDENVPLADTISNSSSDTPVSDNVTIPDEDTALADSIPQTGDTTHSALPVALAGVAALAGALYLSLRKRI